MREAGQPIASIVARGQKERLVDQWPRAKREAEKKRLVHPIASSLKRGFLEETCPTTFSQLLAIGRLVSLLSLSLRSRQFVDRSLFLVSRSARGNRATGITS